MLHLPEGIYFGRVKTCSFFGSQKATFDGQPELHPLEVKITNFFNHGHSGLLELGKIQGLDPRFSRVLKSRV
jgi:hypothetical protein